ncbi:PadR family transcriptional regulator [Conexibacter sp. SYSU D00693]|uniref:PadR family transcriptional regulator n=1 Tax=Conexibacter sp. SYSU D00693 TaxID=2812560 RepID=UPI00196B5984|nr:PadR family transcriptional regulator [Conexibacter sp. SYSU D00693]
MHHGISITGWEAFGPRPGHRFHMHGRGRPGPRGGRVPHRDPFGPSGGPERWGRGPRAARGDVRAGILALLAEEPMHGYQVMRELTERSGGAWRPSPGSVYPTLQQLQDEGLVRSEEAEGGRKVFHLTDEGRPAAEGAVHPQAPWDAVKAAEGGDASDLRDVVGGLLGATRQIAFGGTPEQVAKAREVLVEARKRLYRILADDED